MEISLDSNNDLEILGEMTLTLKPVEKSPLKILAEEHAANNKAKVSDQSQNAASSKPANGESSRNETTQMTESKEEIKEKMPNEDPVTAEDDDDIVPLDNDGDDPDGADDEAIMELSLAKVPPRAAGQSYENKSCCSQSQLEN